MKKILAIFILTFQFNLISFSQINSVKHNLDILSITPQWANQTISINLGDYYTYLTQENPKEQIIGFMSWGDRKLDIQAPFEQFLYITFDNTGIFLKFINTTKLGEHYIHKFENGDLRAILYFDGTKRSSSGMGAGGVFKFYYKGKIFKTTKFWTSL